MHRPDRKIDRSDRKYPFSQFHNPTDGVTEEQNVGNSSRSSLERILGDGGLGRGGDQRGGGKNEEVDRGIFQETRAPEARRKNRRSAPGWTEEKDRRGRRVARRNYHRKREEAKRMKETAVVDETGRADGRAGYEGEKDEGHEGRAIFLKNIPQTVAREREGEETLRVAAGNCRQAGIRDTEEG